MKAVRDVHSNFAALCAAGANVYDRWRSVATR